MDISDRIDHMATKSKGLEIVASDWHGYKLMIEEGILAAFCLRDPSTVVLFCFLDLMFHFNVFLWKHPHLKNFFVMKIMFFFAVKWAFFQKETKVFKCILYFFN